jgi:hypothetical protein
VLHFLNGAKMEENLNVTHIALIPKKKQPLDVSLILGLLVSTM